MQTPTDAPQHPQLAENGEVEALRACIVQLQARLAALETRLAYIDARLYQHAPFPPGVQPACQKCGLIWTNHAMGYVCGIAGCPNHAGIAQGAAP